MLFNILMPASIMLTCLAFMFAVDLLAKRMVAPKSEEDQLVDELIDNKIGFDEFELRLRDIVQKEKKEKIKRERIEKIKKLNHESR